MTSPNLTVFTPEEEAQAKALWNRCYTFLTTVVDPADMQNWINQIEARGYRKGELALYGPSDVFWEKIEERFTDAFNTLHMLYLKNENGVIIFEYPNTVEINSEPILAPSASERVRTIDNYVTVLNETLNFDTFLESDCNRVARSVGEAVAIRPGQAPLNVLFIHGPSGVGKTHLSQAIGQRVRSLHPSKRVAYVSCSKFEAQYMHDARFNDKFSFIEFYQQMDVLIIDDIQGLVGKVKTQHAFFEIFNHLYLHGKQIILTCDMPPVALDGLEHRLQTRIAASMMIQLDRPDLELRRKILKSRIASSGVELGEEVVEYIATNMQSNVRELEGTMNTLLTYAQIQRTPIDINFACTVMSQTVNMNKAPLTLEDISEFVANEFGISIEDLRSSSRKKTLAHPRQIVMYLCQKHTDQTLMVIAQKLKRKNHTTVMHGVRSITDLAEQNLEFRSSLQDLEERLLARG